MPGRPLDGTELEAAILAAAELDGLIQGHDVVFALTDSREAR